jgi:DNA polymerase I
MTTLLIDSNALCHRARHAMKGSGLSHEEMSTEVVFSFCNQIYNLAKYLESNKFVFCWDSRESKRRKMYPGYKKKNKEKTQEDIDFDNLTLPQFDEIRCKLLPCMGFNNIFLKEGYESDDLIAALVMKYPNRFTIISRDNDLFQLLFYADMFDPQTKRLYTKKTFFSQHGIVPSKWAMVKAIAGCTSDTVEGVPRVGEVTAVKYLKGTLKEKSKAYQSIADNQPIIDRNLKLVKLPLAGMNGNMTLTEDSISLKKFMETFSDYGFKTFLGQDLRGWEEHFKL